MILHLKSKIGDVKALFPAAEAFSKASGCGLLLLGTGAAASERHLLVCRHLAERAFADKHNLAKSLKNETLLFVAATMKIDRAIGRAGVKDPHDFVVFALGKCDKSKILEALEARELPIKFAGNELGMIERSALSRIKE